MCKNEISELKRGHKTVLAICSINGEVLPYLCHLRKLTFGLVHATSATKPIEYPVNLGVIIFI